MSLEFSKSTSIARESALDDFAEGQESFSSIERCPQPVIAALHGACVGGAVDLACACDIRFCSQDAKFCIAEVKVGLAADVGTLQRMPRVRLKSCFKVGVVWCFCGFIAIVDFNDRLRITWLGEALPCH